MTDCDGTGQSISAGIDGAADVDWYKFTGTDTFGCVVDPTATATGSVNVCMYAECNGLSLSCDSGSPSTEGGLQGCCDTATGTAKLSINCSGSSDNATVYVKVTAPNVTQCTPYSVSTHY